jgi:hypothetical protein
VIGPLKFAKKYFDIKLHFLGFRPCFELLELKDWFHKIIKVFELK